MTDYRKRYWEEYRRFRKDGYTIKESRERAKKRVKIVKGDDYIDIISDMIPTVMMLGIVGSVAQNIPKINRLYRKKKANTSQREKEREEG